MGQLGDAMMRSGRILSYQNTNIRLRIFAEQAQDFAWRCPVSCQNLAYIAVAGFGQRVELLHYLGRMRARLRAVFRCACSLQGIPPKTTADWQFGPTYRFIRKKVFYRLRLANP